ncbi:flagellar hook-length control protein FliK [Blastomonas sp. AAP53]|uniref:flagellar hook-length control protein FliK n=1 Tax=Blastomonas sp. AAP53 TaxID=1248760 RepID=UPI0002DEC09F|nr:flagellar hook-length control protein FliK [Blastomonas sp. AAP53]
MSQDLMQALSGSSLLSLSIGTLPAVKQGMSLDANPFASQLALMTGADAAATGAFAPVAEAPLAGEGAFAVALAEVAAPSAPDAAPVTPVVAPTAVAAPAAMVAPVQPAAPAAPIVAALPEDASATQIIEAAFAGAAQLEAPAQVTAPVVARVTPLAPRQPAPQDVAPQTTKPVVTPTAVAQVAPLVARPVAIADAAMPADAELTLASVLEAAPAEEDATAPADTVRPHRRAKVDTPILAADAASPVAIPLAPVQPPVARADIPETDMGATRVAAEAALQAPRKTGPDDAAGLPAQRAIAPAPVAAATAPVAQSGETLPAPPALKPRAARLADEPVSTDTLVAPVALPVDAAANIRAPMAAMPVTAPVQPAQRSDLPVSVSPAETPADRTVAAPATPIDAISLEASPTASGTPTGPVPSAPIVSAPVTRDTAVVAGQAQATPAPVTPAADPAAAAQTVAPSVAEQVVQTLSQPAQSTSGARPAATAPRGIVSPAARRAIDAAAQSSRPAEALSALFDRAEMDIDPAAPIARTDFGAASGLEPVPPLWAAALNAVSAPSQAIPGITVPLTSEAAAAAPLESLAFDAGFVANIETQIARVANGGQMVRMQIMPENLGRIDIEMLAGPERDQIRIVTEHDAVRDTLVSSQHRLEQDLRSNAQRPADVTVELRQQSPGMQNGSAQQQQQQRSQTGAETMTARDGSQRQQTADTGTEVNLPPRRPRGNVRYA